MYAKQDDIHGCPLVEQGVIHINSISHVGDAIIGFKPLQENGLKPVLPRRGTGRYTVGEKCGAE